METIEAEVEKNGIQTPAILLIGEVVKLKQLN
jgi:siroheme synthase